MEVGWRELAYALAAGWAGFLTWWGKVLYGKLEDKATRAELLSYMAEARTARQEINAKLDHVGAATQQTAVCLAKLEGRLTGQGK
jgi:hypothetical protein